MSIVINGGGTVTGISAGGLPDDVITADDLANSINSAIAANTAKVTNSTSASDLTSGTLPMARLSGTLPALNGSALTSLPAQTLSGLSDTTISTADPTRTVNPSATGHLWLNKTSGSIYVCTDATSNSNVWMNTGEGIGSIGAIDIFGDNSATALWAMNGNTNDSGGTYNGTNTGITFATGKSASSGQGGVINGSDSMTSSISVQPPFSLSFWLKTSGIAARNGILFTFGNNTYITEGYGSSGGFSFHQPGVKEQSSQAGISENNSTWTHVVYTMAAFASTPTNQRWYFNSAFAALVSSGAGQGGSFNSYSGTFAINGGLNGTIDHVRLFNKVLSTSEITTLYNEI